MIAMNLINMNDCHELINGHALQSTLYRLYSYQRTKGKCVSIAVCFQRLRKCCQSCHAMKLCYQTDNPSTAFCLNARF